MFLGYLVALTVFLLIPRPEQHLSADFKDLLREVFFIYIDPIAHLLCFTLLGFLASLIPWRWGRLTMLSLLATYGTLTEIIQHFIPTRTAEWSDLVQDLLGILAGMAAASVFLNWWRGDQSEETDEATSG